MSLRDQVDVARQFLKHVEVCPLPKEVLELNRLLKTEEFPSPQKVRRIISNDPILTGELLGLANSPQILGDYPKHSDLDSAIQTIGMRKLQNLVFSIISKRMTENNIVKGLNYHSIQIGMICAELSKYTKEIAADEAYVMGLLHDIGAFAMQELDAYYGQGFLPSLIRHYTMHKREYAQYGTSHSAMGYCIVTEWGVNKHIANAILLHHVVQLNNIKHPREKVLAAILEFAHAIAGIKSRDKSLYSELLEVQKHSAEILGLDEAQIQELHLMFET